MPKLNAYAVFDLKGSCYGLPFFASNNMTAIRSFGDACKDSKSPWNAHPEDYILRLIGSYEDGAAELSACSIQHIAHASDFVAGSNPAPLAIPIPGAGPPRSTFGRDVDLVTGKGGAV